MDGDSSPPSPPSPPTHWTPSAREASREFLRRVPRDFARDHLLLSQGRSSGVELLAVADSTPASVIHNVGVRLETPVRTRLAEGEAIARAIDESYGDPGQEDGSDPLEDVVDPAELEELIGDAQRDLLATEGKGPVVRFVDASLFQALGRGASDLHVQPTAKSTLIRCRVDGVLYTMREIPRHLAPALVSRIKVMGRMDIAERRVAQDGRATVTIGARPIDLRISTFPTSYGERAVLRLLDNTRRPCELETLGMPEDLAQRFLAQARRSNGIILVTGPTGSGKTTTLYSTLRRIASQDVNVMTIEDPIEYDLSSLGLAVSQSQVNPKKGVSFATGLRHVLRQDPDVILVGEIRDAETARIAIQASQTGHLVFSTLHTNDAPSAVTRLVDLGVEPYLISSSLSAVLAQRLVRLRHGDCEGRGCETCFQTGLLGRTGLFELMVVDEEIASLIAQREELATIRAAARERGMRSLREEGEELVSRGRTSRAEVDRVVQGAR